MKVQPVATMIAALLLSSTGFAEDAELAALKRGMPADVAAFIDREGACNHWAGEEPYDNERRAEIAVATRDLRCNALDADEAQLRRRYAKNARVQDALDKAPGLFQ